MLGFGVLSLLAKTRLARFVTDWANWYRVKQHNRAWASRKATRLLNNMRAMAVWPYPEPRRFDVMARKRRQLCSIFDLD